MNKVIEDAKGRLAQAKEAVAHWDAELARIEDLPENNVYESLGAAEEALTTRMRERATEACNVGVEEYTCGFTVDGLRFSGTVRFEYGLRLQGSYEVDSTDFVCNIIKENA